MSIVREIAQTTKKLPTHVEIAKDAVVGFTISTISHGTAAGTDLVTEYLPLKAVFWMRWVINIISEPSIYSSFL